MPDPFEYLLALTAAAGMSALVALGLAKRRVPVNIVGGLALAGGIASGAYVLKLPVSWPPATAVGRLFALLLPAAIGIETVLAIPSVPRWLLWIGRVSLSMAAGRILLHGSVYLAEDHAEWSTWQAKLVMAGSGAALLVVWVLLAALAERSGGVSIPLALAEASFCSGLAIMLKGYVGGGEASLPIVGALAGYTLAVGHRRNQSGVCESVIGVSVCALFGLVFVGRWFGKLSNASALVLFFAPLFCWTSELPILRRLPQWQTASLRLAAVALPLIAVVIFAKRDFDRGLRPLLRLDAVRDASESVSASRLRDVSERTGMDRSALSKLESGERSNPTVETLVRYADAVGMRLEVSLVEAQ